ncbi:MAG TPA: hypothetical protein VGB42_03555 [Candidatus Thermoplasmatota archaeon]
MRSGRQRARVDGRTETVGRVVDELRARFGPGAVRRASLLSREAKEA